MSSNNHTPIATGAAANAAVVNSPIGQLDAAMGALTSLATATQASLVAAINEVRAGVAGGAAVTTAQLIAWTEGGAYEMTATTINATYGCISSGTVKWPDTSSGTFTTTSVNTTFGAIDAYTITHAASSKTVTQATVTRDTDGNVTSKPPLTVA